MFNHSKAIPSRIILSDLIAVLTACDVHPTLAAPIPVELQTATTTPGNQSRIWLLTWMLF